MKKRPDILSGLFLLCPKGDLTPNFLLTTFFNSKSKYPRWCEAMLHTRKIGTRGRSSQPCWTNRKCPSFCWGISYWCPKGDLNPYALKRALAPQASASTNSATRTGVWYRRSTTDRDYHIFCLMLYQRRIMSSRSLSFSGLFTKFR